MYEAIMDLVEVLRIADLFRNSHGRKVLSSLDIQDALRVILRDDPDGVIMKCVTFTMKCVTFTMKWDGKTKRPEMFNETKAFMLGNCPCQKLNSTAILYFISLYTQPSAQ
jgi:hypothetical protein